MHMLKYSYNELSLMLWLTIVALVDVLLPQNFNNYRYDSDNFLFIYLLFTVLDILTSVSKYCYMIDS